MSSTYRFFNKQRQQQRETPVTETAIARDIDYSARVRSNVVGVHHCGNKCGVSLSYEKGDKVALCKVCGAVNDLDAFTIQRVYVPQHPSQHGVVDTR